MNGLTFALGIDKRFRIEEFLPLTFFRKQNLNRYGSAIERSSHKMGLLGYSPGVSCRSGLDTGTQKTPRSSPSLDASISLIAAPSVL